MVNIAGSRSYLRQVERRVQEAFHIYKRQPKINRDSGLETLVAKRIYIYMTANKYFDGLSQKGVLPNHLDAWSMPRFPMKQSMMPVRIMWNLLSMARLEKCFGIRYPFIQTGIKHYRFPPLCQVIFNDYKNL